MSVYQKLLNVRDEKGAGFLVLLDPDRMSLPEIVDLAKKSEEGGADGFLVGSSLLLSTRFDEAVREIKANVKVPVVIFPGNANQVSRHADAILFLSLISGRNAHLLIGEQVKAAPAIKEFDLEPIPTGYLLIESGGTTSVQFMSDTQPLPRNKPDIAKAHALAAEYLGMKLVFLEAGSGAENPVPDKIIREVKEFVSIPIVVGGGVKDPDVAYAKVKNGASFVVIGNFLEEDDSLINEFADAIHISKRAKAI
ncbi:MAG: geranylgeranylglyceryl/heptaprenylglyceryl phosphate synthase [candidate division Zixibacteria bacterium]|nr:geranylgeranylglyceryl/heptaprenylglyceryl phosphate synthase [candidate division Zixibacteria bacterium]